MTLVSYNVNGIKQKREDIRLYMQSLDADVFALQETLRTPDLFRLHFYGYQCIERTMETGPGKRGLAIAVKQCFSAYQVGVGSDYWLFVRIVGGNLKSPIIVGNVYMPHRNVVVPHLHRECRINLQAEVTSLHRRYPTDPIIVLGDFNRRAVAMEKLLRGMPDMCEPKVLGDPRTLRKAHGGQLDHVLVSTTHSACMHNVYVDQSVDLSDHWPIISSLALLSGRAKDNEVSKPTWRLPKTSSKKQEWCEFLQCHNYWDVLAAEVDNEEDPVEDRVLDIDERIIPTGPATELKYGQMNNLATKFVDTCNLIGTAAKVRIERPQAKRAAHPTSKAHARAAKKQRKLYVACKCARRSGNVQRIRQASRAYKAQRKLTKQLAKKAKTERWYQAIRDAEENKKNDPRQLWKWCAELGGWSRKRQTQRLQPMCDKNGVLQTDAARVGEVWFEHYAHLAADLTGHSQDPEYWDGVLSPNTNSSTVPTLPGLNEDLTAAEIRETIVFLKNNKSPGPDGIPGEVLKGLLGKEEEPKGFRILVRILKMMWEFGYVPEAWQTALVVSIFKKGDPTSAGNYRGISLMDTVLKILVTLVTRRLSGALEKAGILSKGQAGFRKREECIGQAIALHEIVRRRKLMGMATFALFLDFQKAYDVVPHQALFRKLRLVGIGGKVLRFIVALYANSKVRVRQGDGQLTDAFPLLRGLRQGCPMSPILFTVFINDIFDSGTRSGVSIPMLRSVIPGLMFADDTIALADSADALQLQLAKVVAWSDMHEMTFGVDKCALLKFSGDVNQTNSSLEEMQDSFRDASVWQIHGAPIPVVTEYTYLGLTFTSTLDVKAMIKGRLGAGHRQLQGMIPFLKCNAIAIDLKTMVVQSVIIPAFLYGSELWGMDKKASDKIQRSIYGLWRIMVAGSGAVNFTPITQLQLEMGVPFVCVTAALRRLRAFTKFRSLATWISNLVVTPLRSKKRSWVTQTEWWLNCQHLSYSVGRSAADGGAAFVEHAAAMSVELADSLTSREITNAVKMCPSLQRYLQAEYIPLGRLPWNPALGRGCQLLIKFRIGAYWNYEKLARAQLVSPRFLHWCPFCKRDTAESLTHILLQCEAWAESRQAILGRELVTCANHLRSVQEGEQLHASNGAEDPEDNRRRIALLLYGGKPGTVTGQMIGYHPYWSGLEVMAPGTHTEMVVPIPQGTRDAHSQEGLALAVDECCAFKVFRFLMEVDKRRTTIMRREPGWLSSVITTSLGTNVYD